MNAKYHGGFDANLQVVMDGVMLLTCCQVLFFHVCVENSCALKLVLKWLGESLMTRVLIL